MDGFWIADDCVISICWRNQNMMKKEKEKNTIRLSPPKPGPTIVG